DGAGRLEEHVVDSVIARRAQPRRKQFMLTQYAVKLQEASVAQQLRMERASLGGKLRCRGRHVRRNTWWTSQACGRTTRHNRLIAGRSTDCGIDAIRQRLVIAWKYRHNGRRAIQKLHDHGHV